MLYHNLAWPHETLSTVQKYEGQISDVFIISVPYTVHVCDLEIYSSVLLRPERLLKGDKNMQPVGLATACANFSCRYMEGGAQFVEKCRLGKRAIGIG